MKESLRRLHAFRREVKPKAMVSERLKTIMHWTYWKPYQLAEAIGVDRASIHYWLNGPQEPEAESIRKICASLRVSSDWLLGLSDEGGPTEPKQGS